MRSHSDSEEFSYKIIVINITLHAFILSYPQHLHLLSSDPQSEELIFRRTRRPTRHRRRCQPDVLRLLTGFNTCEPSHNEATLIVLVRRVHNSYYATLADLGDREGREILRRNGM